MDVKVFPFILLLVFVGWTSSAMGQEKKQANPEVRVAEGESDSTLIYSFLEKADEANAAGDVRKQRSLLDQAQKNADSLAIPSLQKVVEKELGEYYLESNYYDSAQIVLERAAGRTSDNNLQAEIFNYLGTAYLYQSQYSQAMNTYNKGLAIIDSLKVPHTYMAINTNKAGIYEKLGNLSEAISIYQKGINFAETVGDSSFLATALNNLGKLYYEEGSLKKGMPYLEEAISVSEDQDFFTTLLRATHNLASTHRDLGNYDTSQELFEKAWSLHEKVRPDSPPIQLLFNMGMYHLKVSELDEAEQHFQESLDYSRQAGIPEGLFHNNVGLGDVALERGDFVASTNFYDRAFEVAEKIDSPLFRVTASQNLYEAYKDNGNFEEALKYHEIAKEVSDSLTKVQQDEQLALAETELGLRQQQRINQLLQERQQQQEARIYTQNWLMGISALVIVIILITIFVLYRSNKERQRVNRELAELNEVKDRMMAVIAHDLRSPMTSMQGIFYLLKDDELPVDEIRKIASELEVSVQQNINMMDNLLNWANNQMSGLDIELEKVSAHEVVQDIFDNLSLQADHKSIALINNVDKGLQVKADPNLLRLIVRNLLNNAIKFSNEGGTVTVGTEERNGEVIFKVEDTGIGIPEEEKKHLFSGQGNSRAGTQNENGSGLGLQLCKEFVEKQKGKIYLESQEGVGTTFYVSLPKAG